MVSRQCILAMELKDIGREILMDRELSVKSVNIFPRQYYAIQYLEKTGCSS